MRRSLIIRLMTAVLPLALGACRSGPAEAIQEAVSAPAPTTWIGITMHESMLNDYAIGKKVVVGYTVPAAPADGIVKKGDVIVKVQGHAIAGGVDVQNAVHAEAPGTEITLEVLRDGKPTTLKVRAEARPATDRMLSRAYAGKPLPSLSGIVSIAKTDGDGRIVPGSQCVMRKKTACPGYGRAGDTHFAAGKVTVIAFWTRWNDVLDDTNRPLFETLGNWRHRYGANGLAIVGMTQDDPQTVEKYVHDKGYFPPMPLVSAFYGDVGALAMATGLAPCVLVLDKDGIVRGGATGGSADTLKPLMKNVIEPLLSLHQ